MTLHTFNPAVAPSPGTTNTPRVSLNKAEFGDGYTQTSPKGINHIRRTLTLKWEGLLPEQAAALDSFFTGQGGYIPFYYRHPVEGVTRKWTCEEWGSTYGAPAKFTATLVECFAP